MSYPKFKTGRPRGWFLCLVIGLSPSVRAEEVAEDGFSSFQTTTAFNRKAGASFEAAPNAEQTGVLATIYAALLGKDREILRTSAKTTDLLEGESDLYLGGLRVWSKQGDLKKGKLNYEIGVPPARMRMPVVAFPVGPVLVKLDAGIAYSADVFGELAPDLTGVTARLTPEAQASGFVEGYASLAAVRAGVGGQLDLIDANAKLQARIPYKKQTGVTGGMMFDRSGYLKFLYGKFYGFVDVFAVWKWRWKRVLSPTLYRWKGYCVPIQSEPAFPGEDPCRLD